MKKLFEEKILCTLKTEFEGVETDPSLYPVVGNRSETEPNPTQL